MFFVDVFGPMGISNSTLSWLAHKASRGSKSGVTNLPGAARAANDWELKSQGAENGRHSAMRLLNLQKDSQLFIVTNHVSDIENRHGKIWVYVMASNIGGHRRVTLYK
jgi:hypothetical protein